MKPFVAGYEIAGFIGERALGQRRDVSAEHEKRRIRGGILDRGCQGGRAGHVLRRCRRLMTVNHDRNNDGREGLDAIRRPLGRQLIRLCIDNFDGEPTWGRTKVAMRPAHTGFSTAVSRLPKDW